MAPSVRRAATRLKTEATRKPRRTRRKKKLQEPKKINKVSSAVEDFASNTSISSSYNTCSKSDSCTVDADQFVDVTANACSTPKAQRFRIPEIGTCPPAPKKQRVASNCSLRRKPIAFFVPPDLDLFFFLIPRDIPV